MRRMGGCVEAIVYRASRVPLRTELHNHGVRTQSVPSPLVTTRGTSIRPLTPGHYPTLEEQQELGLRVRLRLRLREGLWSRLALCSEYF